ncbi:hypothetical protein GMDG_07552 [Pseudogymnoascus destructans 20631-21]|uniref:NRPS-like protein biosynthetic cluster n=1 Tax=Pseudogymnoascus destructans (strain ATCC MYA-4855 / 20631-21) TaxID=658429 RepID=L8FYU4_PSED2|nr:hypothetical protein GMDG_07552 [Pseudogymnoascus destructans 20631-21]
MSYVQWLFEGLDYDQNKPIYIDANNPNRSLSAAQVKTLVLKIGSGLQKFGLQKGDCACVVSLNDIYYTPTYLGIIAAGGIFTGVNPGYTVFEVAHHLRVCNAKFVIADLQTLSKVKEAATEVGIPESNIIIFDVHHEGVLSGATSFWDLIGDDEITVVDVVDSANVPASYISSSGTSGLPKAVVIPHAYLINQCQIQTERKMSYEVSRLCCLPPFPAYAAPSQHGMPLKTGSPCYVMPRYDGNSVLDAVEKYQITEVLLVPPMVLSLPLLPKCTISAVASLRQVFCGGAAIAYHIQEQLYDILHPDARINQIFGMSECGWVCGFQYPEKDETSSVGRPFAGFSLKVVDDAGNDCLEDGQVGEIYIKPPFPMLGYLNNPTATAEAFAPGGWTRSGDVGYVKDSKWYVPDRKKDVIKVKGWQVSPTELEGVLLLHEDIIDAGVIGIQAANTYDGAPRGFVVRRPGSTITEDDAKVWMKERLVRYKQVDRVIFVTDIPRNPTGKILRRLLQEGKYTEEVPAVGEHTAVSEAAVEKVLVTENGTSNSAAIDEHVAAPKAIAQEILVTENGTSNSAAIDEHVAAPKAIAQEVLVAENGTSNSAPIEGQIAVPEAIVEEAFITENGVSSSADASEHIAAPNAIVVTWNGNPKVLVTENGNSSPAAVYEYIALPKTVYQKVLVTENGNPGAAPVYEYIAVPETVYQKVLVTRNGNTGFAVTGEQIAAPETVDHKAPGTKNGLSGSTTGCSHIALSEAVAQKLLSTENGNASPAAACEHIVLPDVVVEEVPIVENRISSSVLPSEDRVAVPSS